MGKRTILENWKELENKEFNEGDKLANVTLMLQYRDLIEGVLEVYNASNLQVAEEKMSEKFNSQKKAIENVERLKQNQKGLAIKFIEQKGKGQSEVFQQLTEKLKDFSEFIDNQKEEVQQALKNILEEDQDIIEKMDQELGSKYQSIKKQLMKYLGTNNTNSINETTIIEKADQDIDLENNTPSQIAAKIKDIIKEMFNNENIDKSYHPTNFSKKNGINITQIFSKQNINNMNISVDEDGNNVITIKTETNHATSYIKMIIRSKETESTSNNGSINQLITTELYNKKEDEIDDFSKRISTKKSNLQDQNSPYTNNLKQRFFRRYIGLTETYEKLNLPKEENLFHKNLEALQKKLPIGSTLEVIQKEGKLKLKGQHTYPLPTRDAFNDKIECNEGETLHIVGYVFQHKAKNRYIPILKHTKDIPEYIQAYNSYSEYYEDSKNEFKKFQQETEINIMNSIKNEMTRDKDDITVPAIRRPGKKDYIRYIIGFNENGQPIVVQDINDHNEISDNNKIHYIISTEILAELKQQMDNVKANSEQSRIILPGDQKPTSAVIFKISEKKEETT